MSRDDEPGAELANVTYLPTRLDGEVVEAEVIDDVTWSQRQLKETALARRGDYARDAQAVVRVTRTAVTHPVTVTTVRHACYIPAGFWVLAKRAWEAKTNSPIVRQIRAAEARGDYEAVERLLTLDERAKERRHRSLMDWVKLPFELVKLGGYFLAGWFGFLLALGILWSAGTGDWSHLIQPVSGFVTLVTWICWLVAIAWVPLIAALPWLVLVTLWWVGKNAGVTPGWLERNNGERDATVTAEGYAAALAHLGIPQLNKAIKNGWQVEYLIPPTLVNNRGYQVVHSIPMGTTPGMFADKRDVLARNVLRAPLEVWPAAAERSGFVETWIAHPGSTSRPGAKYPLLHEGTVDVFKGVPFGQSQRGDVIEPPLMEASMVVGGRPGQGKSNAVRVIMAGAALDPLADLRVFVFANNGDFDAYEPRLSRYRKGVDDSVVADAVAELRKLYAEVERREGRLSELGAKKLTRGIAEKHPDMRPIVVAFSECHEMYGDSDLGKEAADLSVLVVKRMRKVGMFLVFDTQSSRANAIPSALVELFKYNACFAVKTWRSNDGFLGDGSFQAGIRATELRPTKDRGTSLVTGVTDEAFELLDWYYIEADDDTGFDAATTVIARSMKKAKVTKAGSAPEEVRDLLEDVRELMGDDVRSKASEIAVMLRRTAPDYLPYRNLDGIKLAAMLAKEEVEVRMYRGHPRIWATEVLRARDMREVGDR